MVYMPMGGVRVGVFPFNLTVRPSSASSARCTVMQPVGGGGTTHLLPDGETADPGVLRKTLVKLNVQHDANHVFDPTGRTTMTKMNIDATFNLQQRLLAASEMFIAGSLWRASTAAAREQKTIRSCSL